MSTNTEAIRAWSADADDLRKKMRLAMQDGKVDDWAAERMLYVVDYLDTLLQGFFALQNILVEQYGHNGQVIGQTIFEKIENYVQASLENLPVEIKAALDNTLKGLETQRKQTEKVLAALEKLPEQWTAELVAEKVQPLVEHISNALTGTIDASGIQKALAEHVQSVAEKAIKDNRKDLQSSIRTALDNDTDMAGFVREIQADLLAGLRKEVEDTALMERLQEPLMNAVKEATTRLFHSKEWREEVSESAREATGEAVRSILRSNAEETMADLKQITADTLENMRQMQAQMKAMQGEMAALCGNPESFQAAVMVRVVEAAIPNVVTAASAEVLKMFAGNEGE